MVCWCTINHQLNKCPIITIKNCENIKNFKLKIHLKIVFAWNGLIDFCDKIVFLDLADFTKKSAVSIDTPTTPGSGSMTIPQSLNSPRLTSPRPSLAGGKGRKRALSHSPLSEFLDIQSLTRSSEGSLHLTPILLNSNSRSSSTASGSYGHLSAGKSAAPVLPVCIVIKMQHHLF